MRILTALAMAAVSLTGAEPDFVIGVCTHFQQSKGILDNNLAAILDAGIVSIRDEMTWNGVESKRGLMAIPDSWRMYVDHAVAAGIEPLLILDYGNKFYDSGDKPRSPEAIEAFAKYAEFVVREFRGKVRLYEVWNEWDIGIGGTTPGDADSYMRLLTAVYPRIKKADPEAIVMAGAPTSGGISKGWLRGILAGGALRHSDAISIHTYNYSQAGRNRSPEAWLKFVESAQSSIRDANGGADFPLYVTEMGWPTHTGTAGMSPELSAAYLARTFLLARTLPYLRGVWWYDFQDDGWKPEEREHNFGMVRADGTPKPSYYALAYVAALVKFGITEQIDVGDPDVWILRFGDVLAAWSASEQPKRLRLTVSKPAEPMRIGEVGRPEMERPWGYRDWTTNARTELDPLSIGVTVGSTPTLIWDAPHDIRIELPWRHDQTFVATDRSGRLAHARPLRQHAATHSATSRRRAPQPPPHLDHHDVVQRLPRHAPRQAHDQRHHRPR